MPQHDERFTIRRKIIKFFGAAFHVYDDKGGLVAFCKQKAFRLREDIRLYTDESLAEEFLSLRSRQVIDFGATYDVALPDGQVIASLRRKGLKSTFLRDSWLVYGPRVDDDAGTPAEPVATLQEDSAGLGFLRRSVDLAAMLVPQKFHLETPEGRSVATLRTHFNPLVYRLSIAIHEEHPDLDELAILATGCLIAAIEGRQN
ncbi:MAG: hypothetical protein AAGH64_05975 [Planctomycetota bacterium]